MELSNSNSPKNPQTDTKPGQQQSGQGNQSGNTGRPVRESDRQEQRGDTTPYERKIKQ